MIRKRFAKQVSEELTQRIVSKAYQDGIKESKLDLINVVDFAEKDLVVGEDNTFTFTVDVKPEFELPEYKGLELEALSEEVEEKDIDEMIDKVRREKADFEPVERAAEKSDYVKFSHEGTIDGKAVSEIAPEKPVYAKMPQTWEEVGSEHSLIPGLADQLEGLKAGDKKDVEVTFPEDFTVEALQGKTAVYAVEVQEVRERRLPEMDEEFFESQQVKDLEEFKERISGYIKNRKSQERGSDLRRQIGEKLSEMVDFGLPESLVEQETEGAMRQVVSENVQRGVAQEELEKNKDDIHAGARQTALQRVKMQLILDKIAAKEDVSVGDEEMSRYIMNQAYQSGKKPDALVKELRKDQNRVRGIQQSLLFDKTLELLVGQAKVSEAKK